MYITCKKLTRGELNYHCGWSKFGLWVLSFPHVHVRDLQLDFFRIQSDKLIAMNDTLSGLRLAMTPFVLHIFF